MSDWRTENMRWTPEKQEKKRVTGYGTRAAWIKAGRPRLWNRLRNLTDLPTSYREAKQQGIRYYFTGKPCQRGHLTARLVISRHCYECHRLDMHQRNSKNIKMPPVLEPVAAVQDWPYRTIVL